MAISSLTRTEAATGAVFLRLLGISTDLPRPVAPLDSIHYDRGTRTFAAGTADRNISPPARHQGDGARARTRWLFPQTRHQTARAAQRQRCGQSLFRDWHLHLSAGDSKDLVDLRELTKFHHRMKMASQKRRRSFCIHVSVCVMKIRRLPQGCPRQADHCCSWEMRDASPPAADSS